MNDVRPIDADALKNKILLVKIFNKVIQDEGLEEVVEAVLRCLSEELAPTLDYAPVRKIDGNTSDGYHTFNELYHHRALLFSVVVSQFKDIAWKSKQHHDGTMFDGMFIVGVNTLQGQATYHYDIEPYWDMFDCKEVERAPEWDGHTSEQAIERIATLRLLEPFKTPVVHGERVDNVDKNGFLRNAWRKCSVCGGLNYSKKPSYCPNCGAKMDGGKKDG